MMTLCYLPSLLSADVLNDFITQQVTIEAQLLDQNISLDEKIVLQEAQEKTIMLPFFQTSKKTFLISPHYDTDCNSLSPLKPKLLM